MVRHAIKILLVIFLLISFGAIFDSCTIIQGILGGDSGGGGSSGETGIAVSGEISIDSSITQYGDVYVGFVDIDPAYPPYPNPVPWADFSTKQTSVSYQHLGYYDGSNTSFTFTFSDVPSGRYFIMAFIDTYNSNSLLDLDPSDNTNPIEPAAAYPVDENDNPYLTDFNSDQSGIYMYIESQGFFEDFDDGMADNWVDDGSGRWEVNVSNWAYDMSGNGSNTELAYSYYDQQFYGNYTYSVDVTQISGSGNEEYGIFFRVQDPWNINSGSFSGYMLGIDSSGNWWLYRYDNGVQTTLNSGSGYLNTGTNVTNTIQIICDYDWLRVYLNGIDVTDYQDSTYSSGYVGVYGQDIIDSTVEYQYDNAYLR